jgi:hypothetical protein
LKSKRPADFGGPLVKVFVIQQLEDDLRNELHVELFARADARRTIEVADGVTNKAEPIGRIG